MLQHYSKIPLYLQLKESLRSSIVSHKLNEGDQIPTEVELSEKYKISRVTVRKAITELVEEGYLIKKQGKGTFVNKQKVERKIIHFLSFTATCMANGLKPSSQVIKKEVISPNSTEINMLKLDQNDLLIFLQRVRYADDKPIMLENNYFSYNKYQSLLEENLNGSLYNLIKEKYNIDPNTPGETSLEIVRASDQVTELLKVISGEPLFYMETVIYDQKDPVHIGKQYIVGDSYKFIF